MIPIRNLWLLMLYAGELAPILKKFNKEGMTIKDIPKWGDDLGSYCERYICEDIYRKPTFVYNYPKDLNKTSIKCINYTKNISPSNKIFTSTRNKILTLDATDPGAIVVSVNALVE